MHLFLGSGGYLGSGGAVLLLIGISLRRWITAEYRNPGSILVCISYFLLLCPHLIDFLQAAVASHTEGWGC